MHRMIWLIVTLMVFAPSVHAADLMDWLEDKAISMGKRGHIITDAMDQAELVTLETRETEMYPKVSPDDKHMLVISSKSRHATISRRLIENGDPVNIVSDLDQLVLGSIAWQGDDTVSFLSYRADSLGLWKKPVEGGMVRRYRRLDGELRSPIILQNGALLAVRLHQLSYRNQVARQYTSSPGGAKKRKAAKVVFENWKMKDRRPHLVSISKEGAESDLTSGVNPALSPDGKRLVFSMQAGRSWHLFMMNVDGSDLVQLTEGRHVDAQPSWSPDGKWIAFTSNRGDADLQKGVRKGSSNWDIWLIAYDGRSLTRLTYDKARDGAPSIANNGRVYFHSDRKVSKATRKLHRVSGSTGGFHIWNVSLPAKAG